MGGVIEYSARGPRRKSALRPSAAACIEQAGIVVIATPWPEFAEIAADQWMRQSAPRTVIDCWRTLENLA
jgi:predicted dinucleotide-binding enzyme